MKQYYEHLTAWLGEYPLVLTAVCLCLLVLAAVAANFVVKRILVRAIHRLLKWTPWEGDDLLAEHGVVSRLSNVVPAMVLGFGVQLVPHLPPDVEKVVGNVCWAFIILTLAIAVGATLDVVTIVWNRRLGAAHKPIKGYVQILKIFVYAVAAILMIAALIDRSPIILLSGLGAMAAVLMLVFQDTLLSFVASVQISTNGMIRQGDWIEMPQANADGDVVDIALHNVRVQNFDKTITTIPTKKFLTESFKNWRGMTEAGGRRIKRSLFIDQNSVHFLTEEEMGNLKEFALLEPYLEAKEEEIGDWNERHGASAPVNRRRLTNLGTFRAYVLAYLRNHPGINQRLTLLVRQLAPTAEGLPLEVYCFTETTAWGPYEGIQADIFDHLLAILPEFGLRIFQTPCGADVRERLGAG